ncbi:hypothetical protein RRG08_033114 [Elysia crispata]|uniref:Uncharacterized protein n=1 Tax=Elysia crispata TaxID=231223 RepID=A0AAE1BAD6_9GAST|nr:hypothetical protein RRG08_033114 [Elysia crispata]
MPSNAKVYLHYGPYEAAGTVEYRQSRLQGLKTILTRAGHIVELRPFKDWNTVELWVNGEKVFSCDIRQLDYGGDGDLDPLCQDASEAVRRAY